MKSRGGGRKQCTGAARRAGRGAWPRRGVQFDKGMGGTLLGSTTAVCGTLVYRSLTNA